MKFIKKDVVCIVVLYSAGLLAAHQFAKISLALEAYSVIYRVSIDRIALLVSAVSMVGVLFGVIAGEVISRVGPRRSFVVAVAVGAVISMLQAGLHDFGILLALRVVEGISHLFIVIAAPVLVAAVSPVKVRALAMAVWGTFFPVGFATAAIAFPILVDVGGVTLVPVAHGIALALVAYVSALVLPPLAPEGNASSSGILKAHLKTYGSLRAAGPAVMFFWHTALFLGISSVATIAFLDAAEAMHMFVLPLVCLVGTICSGAFATRFGGVRTTVLSYVSTSVSAIILTFSDGTYSTITIYAVFFWMGWAPGGVFAAVADLNADLVGRARGLGAIAQLGNLGTFVGVPAFALSLQADDAYGVALLIVAFCAGGLIASSLVHIATRRVQARPY